jgi:outer membrane immunogenic protein
VSYLLGVLLRRNRHFSLDRLLIFPSRIGPGHPQRPLINVVLPVRRFGRCLYAKAPPPVPIYSWTGCYVGGNVGYAWGSSDVIYTQTRAYLTTSPPAAVVFADGLGSPIISVNGFTGGGQIGCNYQIGRVVFGIEGDGEYVGLSKTAAACGTLPVLGATVSPSASVSSHSLFTVRPRAGYAIYRTLFYVTGGYAAGTVNYNETFLHMATNSVEAGAASSMKSGWTIGAGIEYAITNN